MTGILGRDDVARLFADLSSELERRDVQADVFLVGGAAMAVAYDARRLTRDLDAVFHPSGVVREAAAAIATAHGLRPDWLNDAVKGFLPGPDPDAARFFETEHLRVDVASPRYLLAMKILAGRAGADVADIALLYRLCGFSTVAEGLDLVAAAYPAHAISPRIQYILEEIVASPDHDDV